MTPTPYEERAERIRQAIGLHRGECHSSDARFRWIVATEIESAVEEKDREWAEAVGVVGYHGIIPDRDRKALLERVSKAAADEGDGVVVGSHKMTHRPDPLERLLADDGRSESTYRADCDNCGFESKPSIYKFTAQTWKAIHERSCPAKGGS